MVIKKDARNQTTPEKPTSSALQQYNFQLKPQENSSFQSLENNGKHHSTLTNLLENTFIIEEKPDPRILGPGSYEPTYS